MATYLEIKNENGGVVLDDNYQCLEVIDSFPLSQCTKENWGGGGTKYSNYYYRFPRNIPSGAVVGISLNNMPNTNLFSFDITQTHIRFWGEGSAINNIGLVSIAKDDIVNSCTLYVFDVDDSPPKEHGVGLEIYNAVGNVVYSNTKDYLDVIACGSDDTKTLTIPSGKTSVLITLGYDNSYEYYQLAHHYAPTGGEYTKRVGCYINNGTVTLTPQTCMVMYVGDIGDDVPYYDHNTGQWVYPDDIYIDEGPAIYEYSAWLAYGWLVGVIK